MSCVKIFKTTGVVLADDTPVQILPDNLHRKGIFIATVAGTEKIAIGPEPVPEDYFGITPGSPFAMDTIVPAGAIWATGPGTIVYGESI